MSKFKVTLEDGSTVEVGADSIEATEEGFGLITPDNIPDGYYTESAFQSAIQDRVGRAKKATEKELLEDQGFQKRILSKYNIKLDDEGKPLGLESDVDIDKVKQNAINSVKSDYEDKLNEKDQTLNSVLSKAKRSSILEGAGAIGVDPQYLQPLVEGGSPYIVREVEDQFIYDPESNDFYQKDPDGDGFKIGSDGKIPVSKFFEQNKDRFSNLLKDQRQSGSNAKKGSNGKVTPSGNPFKWSRTQKLDYIQEHGNSGWKELLDNYEEPDE